MKRIYLYLASRSKKGIKIITILTGESIVSSRLTDIKFLKLTQLLESNVQNLIYDNRILYEPWIESAKDYNELKDRLKKRGFTNLPMGPNTMLNINQGNIEKVETSNFKIRKTMIRKAKWIIISLTAN